MTLTEFSFIDELLKPVSLKSPQVLFGIGDDAAGLRIPEGFDLLVSTDTLVSGVHFLPHWDPYDIAYKAVMVNVSDMAAMAAQPAWVTLALTLPEMNQDWLQAFVKGLKEALHTWSIDLIGGDTTKGPLSITLTIMGLAPQNQALRRSGAKAGDIILVTGTLGAAALAVSFLEKKDLPPKDKKILMHKLLHPKPRIDYLELLRSFATAAIDISDGLSADLNHLCVASGVGACLDEKAIPLHPLVTHYLQEQAVDFVLSGGDDYELCYTVPASKLNQFGEALKLRNLQSYPIGVIEEGSGLRMQTAPGLIKHLTPAGYTHF